MQIKDIKAIDIHTHIDHGVRYDSPDEVKCYYTAYKEKLLELEKAANIEYLFASTFASVLTDKVIKPENEYTYRLSQECDDIFQWVVIDPRNDDTFRQAEYMLSSEKCVGIKLHPVYHKYSLEDYSDKLFSFSSEYTSIVLIHPEKNMDYILPMADKYPDTTFIMAHLGDESGVRAVKNSKNNNVYVDTSGIASSNNLIVEYAVEQIGSEHILFGTDTYAAGFQRGRIEYALISDADKANILRNNALKLFEKHLKSRT